MQTGYFISMGTCNFHNGFLLVTCLSPFTSGAEEEKEKKGLPERGIAEFMD